MFELIVTGVVQGVGFRPYIFNQCKEKGLKGYIQNIGIGVRIIIDKPDILKEILTTLPPLARIDSVTLNPFSNSEQFETFLIKESSGEGFAEIPPDLFLCSDCYKELHQPNNSRYLYFFNTCTNCGPRYSITIKNPYDRPYTSMEQFVMCSQCHEEYTNPTNRRYHAQTIACPKCGPKLWLTKLSTSSIKTIAEDVHAIKRTANLIKKGKIVAIKGVGGFHLVCNTDEITIMKLRTSTRRKYKPYAIMCRDIKMAKRIAFISETEKILLRSVQRPIVALKKKQHLLYITELSTVGVMLPYTALHYLLFDYITEPIIFTSANLPDEPITTEATQQWVEYVLTHDREIVNAVDDSVMKVTYKHPMLLRRSRGFVPQSLPLYGKTKYSLLAMGAEMNSTFALGKNNRAHLSPYLGNTANWTVFKKYQETLHKFLQFTKTQPEVIISDLHPGYNTTAYAHDLAQKWHIPLASVQHHRAHAYSVAGEHHLDDFAAIVCDGAGYGDDETIWGGEVFHNQERIGHLEYQIQLGGDAATKEPAKMLLGILHNILETESLKQIFKPYFSVHQYQILHSQLERKINCPLTSSCGRILDAAACLLSVCNDRDYDGRAAILLDELATTPYHLSPVIEDNVLYTTPLFHFLVAHLHKDKKRLAATTLHYLAQGLYEIAKQPGVPVVFTGGCAYSTLMTTYMLKQGAKINNQVPAGDGGISFGQISWYSMNNNA